MKKYLSLFFALIVNILVFPADPPVPPVPTEMASAPGGSDGGVGFGSPASPIDMYVFVLIFIAMAFIAYYARSQRKAVQ